MRITVLGCWGGFPFADGGTSSYLVESAGFHLLVDAGSGSLLTLEHYLDPLKLDAVILSHYHHDHIADLGVLQYYRQLKVTTEKVPVLPIYGHTEDSFHFADLTLPEVSKGYPYHENDSIEIGPFQLTFLRTIHPVPCFAMRIVEKASGKVLVFSADSGYLNTFIDFAAKADVFLADTYLFAGNEKHHAHFTSKEAGEIAKEAAVKQLLLTHLPQNGDLSLLQKQAQQAAGSGVAVAYAKKNLLITL